MSLIITLAIREGNIKLPVAHIHLNNWSYSFCRTLSEANHEKLLFYITKLMHRVVFNEPHFIILIIARQHTKSNRIYA